MNNPENNPLKILNRVDNTVRKMDPARLDILFFLLLVVVCAGAVWLMKRAVWLMKLVVGG